MKDIENREIRRNFEVWDLNKEWEEYEYGSGGCNGFVYYGNGYGIGYRYRAQGNGYVYGYGRYRDGNGESRIR